MNAEGLIKWYEIFSSQARNQLAALLLTPSFVDAPRYLFTDTNAPATSQGFYRLRWP